MVRTARAVRELIQEDPEIATALDEILERTEAAGPVQWSDVNDVLTSGQWGRLIETGVLEDADGGFVVSDPEGVRDGLRGDVEASGFDGDEEPPESPSWTTWDKLAGLAALLLFPGYYVGSIRSTVGEVVDVVLGPVDATLPFYIVILILALFTGLVTTLLQANMMNFEIIEYYQGKMQALQERQEEARERDDEEALQELREEQMSQMTENLGMFKEQFRPMVWSMLIIIPVFLWMYWKLRGGHITGSELDLVLPMTGAVDLRSGSVGPVPTWLVWYFLCSLSFSQIVRKSLNVQTPGA